jgi:hypothetical protein
MFLDLIRDARRLAVILTHELSLERFLQITISFGILDVSCAETCAYKCIEGTNAKSHDTLAFRFLSLDAKTWEAASMATANLYNERPPLEVRIISHIHGSVKTALPTSSHRRFFAFFTIFCRTFMHGEI